MIDDARQIASPEPPARPEASSVPAAVRSEQRDGRSSSNGSEVYAALDLGTNNCRLLIACPEGEGFRVIDSFSRIIRLGEGISVTGRISDAAIGRAISALSVCRDKMKFRNARRLRLIATEACRAASNADLFRNQVESKTGIALEVIDRETEATLAVIGCSPLVDPQGRGAILFDIGGGSSELIRLDRDGNGGGGATPRAKAWMSIPLGVVTLAERFGGKEVTRETYALMVQEVAKHIAPFAAEHAIDHRQPLRWAPIRRRRHWRHRTDNPFRG